jgi:hypothetical protein
MYLKIKTSCVKMKLDLLLLKKRSLATSEEKT